MVAKFGLRDLGIIIGGSIFFMLLIYVFIGGGEGIPGIFGPPAYTVRVEGKVCHSILWNADLIEDEVDYTCEKAGFFDFTMVPFSMWQTDDVMLKGELKYDSQIKRDEDSLGALYVLSQIFPSCKTGKLMFARVPAGEYQLTVGAYYDQTTLAEEKVYQIRCG